MTQTISISEFKATCLKIIDQVKNTGKSIIVTKRGKPYALVTRPPAPENNGSWIGSCRNQIKISGDILEPVVDEEEWDVLK
ncbi:MAG: type II toxin-antitoxin system Phd/YefM family antitoxin [Thermodesulfobacteriota bacterium]